MKIIVVIILLCQLHCLHAQELKIQTDSLYSDVLKEQRRLHIVLPSGYTKGSTDKYDVLYLLDGDWSIGLFTEAQGHLHRWEFTPSLIIVGIDNIVIKGENQRFRDLTPTHIEGAPTSGGGPRYLNFIKNELIPYINKTYPSNGSNTIEGHSLGGLFVMDAFVTDPTIFNSYIAADPSFWWDHNYIVNRLSTSIGTLPGIKSLFITGREGSAYRDMGIDKIDSTLLAKNIAGLQWKSVAYDNETHVSNQFKSAYDGLKYTYAPALSGRIGLDPLGGIVIKDKPFRMWNYNLLPEKYLRYTADGSKPDSKSSVMKATNMITLNKTTTVKVSSFFSNEDLIKTVNCNFEIGSTLPAQIKPAGVSPGGLLHTYYAGIKDSLQSIRKRKPTFAGIVNQNTDFSRMGLDGDYYCKQEGFFEAQHEGYYVFECRAGNGTKIYLGDRLIINIHSVGSEGGYQSFIVPLEKGFYPFRMAYYHLKDGVNFDLSYADPTKDGDRSIPSELLYSIKK